MVTLLVTAGIFFAHGAILTSKDMNPFNKSKSKLSQLLTENHYRTIVNLCVCAVSESCLRAHSLEVTLGRTAYHIVSLRKTVQAMFQSGQNCLLVWIDKDDNTAPKVSCV